MTVFLNTYFGMSINRMLLKKPFFNVVVIKIMIISYRNDHIWEIKLFADVGKRLKDIKDTQRTNRNYMLKTQ